MYLNCKYPYSRFRKHDFTGMPLLSFLYSDAIDETDPVLKVKDSNEYLKAKLKHKRFGTPLPPRQIRLKYIQRILT